MSVQAAGPTEILQIPRGAFDEPSLRRPLLGVRLEMRVAIWLDTHPDTI